jgi:hypothetical protein
MAITEGNITPVVLIIGGLVALAVAFFGRKGLKEGKKDTPFNKNLRIVSGIVGGIMIIWAFLMLYEGTWTQFLMLLMFILLGIGLFLPVLPRTNIGTILALIIAAAIGFGLSESSLETWAILIIVLIVFFALFLVFKVLTASMTLLGGTTGSRWILLVLGLISIVIAVWNWE